MVAQTMGDGLRGLLALTAPPVPKRYFGGTHRAEPPEATLERLLPRLGDYGITRVSRITGFDRAGLEVMTATRPNARGLSVANGKGTSRASAKVSAIMEGIERWHAEHPQMPLHFGSATDLAAERPIDLAPLPLLAGATLPGVLTWAEAIDLVDDTPVLVPFDLVHTCWLASVPVSPFFTSTDGLASGSNRVEAALHALCELIEVDAVSLFERLPIERRDERLIDLPSIADPEVAATLAMLEARGFAIALWDVTSDIGIPTVRAALSDRRAPQSPGGLGAGCHPEPGVAALRAITEAAQTRLIALTGTRDDLGAALYGADNGLRYRLATEVERPGTRRWDRLCSSAGHCLREDLRGVATAVVAAGAGPILATDLTQDEEIAVVRLIVPHLVPGAPSGSVVHGQRGSDPARHLA